MAMETKMVYWSNTYADDDHGDDGDDN